MLLGPQGWGRQFSVPKAVPVVASQCLQALVLAVGESGICRLKASTSGLFCPEGGGGCAWRSAPSVAAGDGSLPGSLGREGGKGCPSLGRRHSALSLSSLGNATHEPDPKDDAPHARPAPLHASSGHDATPWHGTRGNSSRGDAPSADAAWADGPSSAGECRGGRGGFFFWGQEGRLKGLGGSRSAQDFCPIVCFSLCPF